MFRLTLATLALLVAIHAPSKAEPAATDEIISVPFQPQIAQTVRYRLVKSRDTGGSMVRKGRPDASAELLLALTVLRADEDGYVIRLAYEGITPVLPTGPAEAQPELVTRLMENLLSQMTLEFRSDETGYPLRMENWEETKKNIEPLFSLAMNAAFSEGESPQQRRQKEQIFENIKQTFLSVDAATAPELFLQDAYPLFALTGAELYRDQDMIYENELPWEITGTTLVVMTTTRVTEVTDGEVSYENRQEYDRDSVVEGVKALLTNMTRNTDKPLSRDQLDQIKELETFNLTEENRTRLSRHDGWPNSVSFVRRVGVDNGWREIGFEFERLEPQR